MFVLSREIPSFDDNEELKVTLKRIMRDELLMKVGEAVFSGNCSPIVVGPVVFDEEINPKGSTVLFLSCEINEIDSIPVRQMFPGNFVESPINKTYCKLKNIPFWKRLKYLFTGNIPFNDLLMY